jgi:hypothetical protein
MNEPRKCACGCSFPVEGRTNKKWATPSCRGRAKRAQDRQGSPQPQRAISRPPMFSVKVPSPELDEDMWVTMEPPLPPVVLDLAAGGDVRVLIEREGAWQWLDVREAPEVALLQWVRPEPEPSPVQRMKDYVNRLLKDPWIRAEMKAARKAVSKAQVHWARNQLISLANGGVTSTAPQALLALAFTKLEGLPERAGQKKPAKQAKAKAKAATKKVKGA